ncbi:MAG: DUF423 domain-containing protein [Bdellovibrionaceae bacterium]|jgi:uncharacterized membrane protein YgdD (TMEM256/DUF423 family)|nr:DUF423 domain-containing protein [Pseudobdellovibrionaceae bacterium]
MKSFISIGAGLAALAVIIGAFGAHALKASLTAYELGIFSTGSDYHFFHALALVLLGIFNKGPKWPGYAFIAGILLFSGSLYAIAILHLPKLGMITPLGGLAFIVGWVGFAMSAHKAK